MKIANGVEILQTMRFMGESIINDVATSIGLLDSGTSSAAGR